MADVLMWTFLILGFYVIFVAYWVAAVGVAPKLVEGSCERLGSSFWKSLLLGIAIGLPGIGIGLVIARLGLPVAQIAGFALVLLIFLAGLCGSAGLCLRIGKGLKCEVDANEPWRRVKRGGTVLGLMIIFPVLGWFLVFPAAVFSGIGALFLSWRDARKLSPVMEVGA
ncbi:hypothetical protein V2O64_19030 [Verrucomicrobiaceae bacterium 227]